MNEMQRQAMKKMAELQKKHAQNRLESWANHYVLEHFNQEIAVPVAQTGVISGRNFGSRIPRGVFFNNQDPLTRFLKAKLSERDFMLALYVGLDVRAELIGQSLQMKPEAVRKQKQRVIRWVLAFMD